MTVVLTITNQLIDSVSVAGFTSGAGSNKVLAFSIDMRVPIES